MEPFLHHLAEYVALAVNLVAIICIAVGTLEAVIGLIRVAAKASSAQDKAAVWMRFASWLVVALTFQLAADIVETTISPSWDDIGQLAAVALIRTFLNYFLSRDIAEIEERSRRKDAEHQAA